MGGDPGDPRDTEQRPVPGSTHTHQPSARGICVQTVPFISVQHRLCLSTKFFDGESPPGTCGTVVKQKSACKHYRYHTTTIVCGINRAPPHWHDVFGINSLPHCTVCWPLASASFRLPTWGIETMHAPSRRTQDSSSEHLLRPLWGRQSRGGTLEFYVSVGGAIFATHFCFASMSKYLRSRSVWSDVLWLMNVVAMPVLPERPVRPISCT